MWKRQRTMVVLLVGLGLIMSVTLYVTRKGVFDNNAAIWLAYVGLGLLFGGGLLVYRYRSYAQVTDTGLKISGLMNSTLIGWDFIRGTKVQPLELHFADSRKRYARSAAKALLPKPALYLRLSGEEAHLAWYRKRLGNQLASADDMVALPIPDPDAMAWEVSSRLPERMSVNLGGARGGAKRRRRRAR
jgi:hypothetical protein